MKSRVIHSIVSLCSVTLVMVILLAASNSFASVNIKSWVTFSSTPQSEVMVSCQHADELPDITMEFGETATYGTTLNIESKENLGGDVKWTYHFRLTNLSPDTMYHYTINIGNSQTGDFTFKTAPVDPCKPFSFIAMGDNRSQGEGSAYGSKFLSAAKNTGADFMVNTGDMVRDGSEINQWEEYLNETFEVSRSVPIMPVIGNHDDGPGEGNGQNVTRIFPTPSNNDENNKSYYSFEYNNAFFAVITNHDTDPAVQAAWLDTQLKATSAMWKFVFVHEPFFTCPALFGLLGHESDESNVGKYYFEVFEDNKVDMVFTGHNHMYEMFKPNNTAGFIDDPSLGTIHITTGGAAESEAIAMMIEPALFCEGRIKQSDNIHFLKIEIDNNNLVLKYFPRGRLGGAPAPPEVHYTITKPETVDCSIVEPPDGDMDDDIEGSEISDGDESELEQEIEEELEEKEAEVSEEPDGDEEEDTKLCTPEEITCSGNDVVQCDNTGTIWGLVEKCGEAGCTAGACNEAVEDGDTDVNETADVAEEDTQQPPANSDSGCQQQGGNATAMAILLLLLSMLALRQKLLVHNNK